MLRRLGLFLAAIPFAVWMALRWPYLVVGLACIPLEEKVSEKLGLTPAMNRILGFVVFMGLLALSFWCLEIIVFLAAIALTADMILLAQKIRARMNERNTVTTEVLVNG